MNLAPRGQITQLSSISFPYTIKDLLVTPLYAYVITNGLFPEDHKLYIIDIGNPFLPKKLGELSTVGIPQSIAVNGNTAYLADQADRVHILDITMPAYPIEIGTVANLGTVLEVEVDGNIAYIARGNDGLDIYDISDPANPKGLGQYKADGSIQELTIQKVPTPDGNETIRAILTIGKHAVQLVDVTNPQQVDPFPVFDVGKADIEQVLVVDQRLYIARRGVGLLIANIRDNGEIRQIAQIETPPNTFGVGLRNDTVYLAKGWKGLQVYDIAKPKNIYPVGTGYSRFWNHKVWVIILTLVSLLIWLAFFAQFVLPVRTAGQRQKIFDRLIIFLLGRHGPAISIENGHKVEGTGESEKKGPGVVWLDTASAAVIRTATRFKGAIGPGVHFTTKHETLTRPLDLHTQVDTLGPFEKDKPFEQKTADQSDEEYNEIQRRRKMTSALTRDGIEVVPNIKVVFRVDTQPAEGNEPGSRFGYRVGISSTEKVNEAKDKKAIYDALAGEGIDPTVPGETPYHRIAWNQLPGRLAADVWREYAAKFTLDELFLATQKPIVEPPLLPAPKSPDPDGTNGSKKRYPAQSGIADMLRVLNGYMAAATKWIDVKKEIKDKAESVEPGHSEAAVEKQRIGTETQTAMQIITEMVKKRLTQPHVPSLNNIGIPADGPSKSKEFELLGKRGLKVLSISISDLRLKEPIEKYRIDQWSANWYGNARDERGRIERRRRYVEIKGEEDGANEYVHNLARHIMKQRPISPAERLRALLMRTRLTIVRDDQLQYRMNTEREDIEEILQWVEDQS
ncbi:MAG TPA: hypothetical protein VK206_25980 [Anaerolineales bacterium]|nr:hypothetical protein [Anaerolineales bacterium]HLO30996.1 hypothetical protein [Anaerolineales bacterium]